MSEPLTPGKLGGLEVRKARDEKQFPSIMLYGTQGVGKTTLACSACEVPDLCPVLLLNIENGAQSVSEIYPDLDVIPITTFGQLQKVFNDLNAKKGAGYKTIILDNVTEGQKQGMEYLQNSGQDKPATDFTDFQNASWQDGSWNRNSQPLDSPILTPDGWKPMESLVIGSWVIGSKGLPVRIIGIHPQGLVDCYEVEFKDGTVVQCSKDHLWTVKRRHSYYPDYETVTTSRIRDMLQSYSVAPTTVEPIQFDERELPIHPYLLGLYLSEGYSNKSSVSIASAIGETIEIAQQYLPDGHTFHNSFGSPSWYVQTEQRMVNQHDKAELNLVRQGLKELNLWELRSENKFIPDIYKFASVEQRLMLLQGYMDGDGSVKSHAGAQFASISEKLCLGFQEIVHSLGGFATVTWQDRVHNVRIRLPEGMNPFRLQRKAETYTPPTYKRARWIREVRHVGVKQMQCISVDAPDGLYVANGYVLTHNSEQMRKMIRYFRNLPVTIIFVAWSKDYGKDTLTSWGPSFSKSFGGEAPGMVNDVYHYYMKGGKRILQTAATDRAVAKDRTRKLPPILEDPNMQVVWEYWTGKRIYTPEVPKSDDKKGLRKVTDK